VPAPRHALPVLCLLLALPAGAAGSAAADHTSAFTVNAPVVNFRIPTFTPEGFRAWLLCGAEGRYVSANELVVTNLTLTVFAGDAASTVDSVFLSPAATAMLDDAQVRGPGLLRFITTEFEATGESWLYDNRQKKVSIHKNVRVVFHVPLKSLL
jgi:hypothetical protein